jgi:succinate dehydrogenase / fumarate reductase cytochrome b subunit
MWSWVLHRITGLAIFFFLLVHILDSAVLGM